MNLKKNDTANFDRNPPVTVNQYDESIRQFCGAYESMFNMAYAALKSKVNEKVDLLIVGAGTGMELCAFGNLSPNWKMTGVDPSREMLAVARQKLKDCKVKNDIDLFEGYIEDLPKERMFNAATCILVMHFLKDDGSKLALLNSMSSHMESGAPLILIDGFGDTDTEEFKTIVGAWKEYPILFGVDKTVVEDGFNNQILKRIQFVSEERITTLLEEAGFRKITRFLTSFAYGGWIAIKS